MNPLESPPIFFLDWPMASEIVVTYLVGCFMALRVSAAHLGYDYSGHFHLDDDDKWGVFACTLCWPIVAPVWLTAQGLSALGPAGRSRLFVGRPPRETRLYLREQAVRQRERELAQAEREAEHRWDEQFARQ